MEIPNWLITIVASSALGISGYTYTQASKVEDLAEDVRYIRGRVDALIDHLLAK